MPTRYELLYILPTTLTDDEVGAQEVKLNGLLTKLGATVESTKRLGKFRLAYPIKKQRHGHYVMVMFTAETSAIAKIEENLRITPEVVRHIILRADEAGSDQKFELIQYTEVVVEGRDDRRRREKSEKEEGKEGAAKPEDKPAAEEPKAAEQPAATTDKKALSSEELDLKIESALSEDVKGV